MEKHWSAAGLELPRHAHSVPLARQRSNQLAVRHHELHLLIFSAYKDWLCSFRLLWHIYSHREHPPCSHVNLVTASHNSVQAMTAQKPKASYVVTPRPMENWILPRWLPSRMVDGNIARRFGIRQVPVFIRAWCRS